MQDKNGQNQKKVSHRQRLQAILAHYKLTQSQLADKLNVQRSTINRVLSEKENGQLGTKTLLSISEKFPELNFEWVFNGEEPMLRQYDQAQQSPKENTCEPTAQYGSMPAEVLRLTEEFRRTIKDVNASWQDVVRAQQHVISTYQDLVKNEN